MGSLGGDRMTQETGTLSSCEKPFGGGLFRSQTRIWIEIVSWVVISVTPEKHNDSFVRSHRSHSLSTL